MSFYVRRTTVTTTNNNGLGFGGIGFSQMQGQYGTFGPSVFMASQGPRTHHNHHRNHQQMFTDHGMPIRGRHHRNHDNYENYERFNARDFDPRTNGERAGDTMSSIGFGLGNFVNGIKAAAGFFGFKF